jgi:acyl carrier protein
MSVNSANEILDEIRKILLLKSIDLADQMGKTPGWDSLRHMKIVFALEKKFGHKIPIPLLGKLISVSEILKYYRSVGIIT